MPPQLSIATLTRRRLAAIKTERPAPTRIQERLVAFWRQEVGPRVAQSQPILFRSGRLAVLCQSQATATELHNLAPSLMRQLNAAKFKVTTIEVKTRPESPPPDNRRYHQPKPVSAANARAVANLSATVSHPGLRQSLVKLSAKLRKL